MTSELPNGFSKEEAMRIAKALISTQGAVGKAQTPEEARVMAQNLLAVYMQQQQQRGGTDQTPLLSKGSSDSSSSSMAATAIRSPMSPAQQIANPASAASYGAGPGSPARAIPRQTGVGTAAKHPQSPHSPGFVSAFANAQPACQSPPSFATAPRSPTSPAPGPRHGFSSRTAPGTSPLTTASGTPPPGTGTGSPPPYAAGGGARTPASPTLVVAHKSSDGLGGILQLPPHIRNITQKKQAGAAGDVPLRTPPFQPGSPVANPASGGAYAAQAQARAHHTDPVETNAERLLSGLLSAPATPAGEGQGRGPPAYARGGAPAAQQPAAAAAAAPKPAAAPAVKSPAKLAPWERKRRGLPTRRNPVEDQLCENLFIQCCESVYLGEA